MQATLSLTRYPILFRRWRGKIPLFSTALSARLCCSFQTLLGFPWFPELFSIGYFVFRFDYLLGFFKSIPVYFILFVMLKGITCTKKHSITSTPNSPKNKKIKNKIVLYRPFVGREGVLCWRKQIELENVMQHEYVILSGMEYVSVGVLINQLFHDYFFSCHIKKWSECSRKSELQPLFCPLWFIIVFVDC